MAGDTKRIVIKIGSNVLTGRNGLPDDHRIEQLVNEVAALTHFGNELIVISSGAVASGRSMIKITEKQDAVLTRQLLASLGQVKLMNRYAAFFDRHKLLCSQVLVTKEDFRDRVHYLNVKNCLETLLHHKVVPIVNENDVVSVTELMFTDNDELAGLIAAMLNADSLIILTNVDGIYNGDPAMPGSKILEEIDGTSIDFSSFVTTGRSQFGRGGMITKSTIAKKTAQLGISVHIANGTKDNIIADVLSGKAAHTRFVPNKKASGKKKWIAHSWSYASGVVRINEGARLALTSEKATSLLPIGIVSIESDFKKGDLVKLTDEDDQLIGLGIAEYGADKAREYAGKKNQKVLVHYDYLYLNN